MNGEHKIDGEVSIIATALNGLSEEQLTLAGQNGGFIKLSDLSESHRAKALEILASDA